MHVFFVVFFICTELCDEDDESETDDEENTNDSSHSSDVDNAHINRDDYSENGNINKSMCLYYYNNPPVLPQRKSVWRYTLPTMFKT